MASHMKRANLYWDKDYSSPEWYASDDKGNSYSIDGWSEQDFIVSIVDELGDSLVNGESFNSLDAAKVFCDEFSKVI